ncbi:MAG: PQQ-dependent sugar dehydrogenase [Alphaproteobacteria bacterium]
MPPSLLSRLLRLALLISPLLLGPAQAQAQAQAQAALLALEPAFPKLRFDRPLVMLQAPGNPDYWYIVEQAGRIFRFANDPGAAAATLILDISRLVDDGPNEAGLLGMAFHPDFQTNHQVFLSYTRNGSPLVSTLSRFQVNVSGDTIDPASETILLSVDQPFGNHNGGHIAFGPDGYLYFGLGDGGSGGDPQGNGQNPDTLLGSLLRLDIDSTSPYTIPPDNPFADGGGRPEIYAWGLRNPWRWSFDRQTGDLWLADVGQNKWEEINIIERGGNYGWNLREGAHPFAGDAPAGLIKPVEPVAEYDHSQGCSVTGGYVYRGDRHPDLVGTYFYGDFCSGRIWGLSGQGGATPRLLADTPFNIASFAQAQDGQLYILDHARGQIHAIAQKP